MKRALLAVSLLVQGCAQPAEPVPTEAETMHQIAADMAELQAIVDEAARQAEAERLAREGASK